MGRFPIMTNRKMHTVSKKKQNCCIIWITCLVKMNEKMDEETRVFGSLKPQILSMMRHIAKQVYFREVTSAMQEQMFRCENCSQIPMSVVFVHLFV